MQIFDLFCESNNKCKFKKHKSDSDTIILLEIATDFANQTTNHIQKCIRSLFFCCSKWKTIANLESDWICNTVTEFDVLRCSKWTQTVCLVTLVLFFLFCLIPFDFSNCTSIIAWLFDALQHLHCVQQQSQHLFLHHLPQPPFL